MRIEFSLKPMKVHRVKDFTPADEAKAEREEHKYRQSMYDMLGDSAKVTELTSKVRAMPKDNTLSHRKTNYLLNDLVGNIALSHMCPIVLYMREPKSTFEKFVYALRFAADGEWSDIPRQNSGVLSPMTVREIVKMLPDTEWGHVLEASTEEHHVTACDFYDAIFYALDYLDDVSIFRRLTRAAQAESMASGIHDILEDVYSKRDAREEREPEKV